MKTNGGWITLKDLQNFPDPIEITPLSITYNKESVIYSQPPPCGGWTTLLALNLIEQISEDRTISNETIIEALYLAHKDRSINPITDLVDYDDIAKNKLSKEYASNLLNDKAFFQKKEKIEKGGETTHFSVVDSEDNAIAVTASINGYFGALAASEELGFLYNTYMDDFIFENPDHPFAVRPNAMAYSSMSPTIVQQNKKNVLVIGSPGSSRIISTVSQITAKWIEDKGIVDLLNDHRIHVSKHKIYFENKKDTLSIDTYFLENYNLYYKFPNQKLSTNKSLNPYFGGVHAIAKENNIWIGVADPRRDGKAITVSNK